MSLFQIYKYSKAFNPGFKTGFYLPEEEGYVNDSGITAIYMSFSEENKNKEINETGIDFSNITAEQISDMFKSELDYNKNNLESSIVKSLSQAIRYIADEISNLNPLNILLRITVQKSLYIKFIAGDQVVVRLEFFGDDDIFDPLSNNTALLFERDKIQTFGFYGSLLDALYYIRRKFRTTANLDSYLRQESENNTSYITTDTNFQAQESI